MTTTGQKAPAAPQPRVQVGPESADELLPPPAPPPLPGPCPPPTSTS